MESLKSISIFAPHPAAAADDCVVPPLAHHVQEDQWNSAFRETQEVSTVAPPGLHELEPAPASAGSGNTATTVPPSAPLPAPRSEKEDGDKSISLDQAYALARASRHSPAAADTASRKPATASEIVKPRACACGRRRGEEEEEGKAEVNARAERFIRQFREELKLERLNSILAYSRCAGAAPAR